MKVLMRILPVLMAFTFFSCAQKQNEKASQVFNEGVSLNLKSIEEQDGGNFENAASLNKQSIEKFQETLKIDSTHPAARSALGHSLYIDRQFKEAIHWFDQANKIDGEAAVIIEKEGFVKST